MYERLIKFSTVIGYWVPGGVAHLWDDMGVTFMRKQMV